MGDTDRELARAKLTRRLSIVGRRDDGYHLLDAEMVSLDLADELVFSPGDGLQVKDAIAWEGDAPIESPTAPTDHTNLVVRALALSGGPAEVQLTKRIPSGAGLGGGSADAAAVLRWRGVLDPATASRLGADVPFCLLGGRAAVGGVGEEIEELAFEERSVVLFTPAFGVSTPAAYAAYDELERDGRIPPGLQNDLEPAAIVVEKRLQDVKALFREVAGENPVLAGSGSSYFLECEGGRAAVIAEQLRGASRAAGLSALILGVKTTAPLGK